MPSGSNNDATIVRPPEGQMVIHFVKIGMGLSQTRINSLSKRAEDMGAMVLPKFVAPQPRKRRHHGAKRFLSQLNPELQLRENQPKLCPTHFVIDDPVKPQQVVDALKFQSLEMMELFLQEYKIQCALPSWITQTRGRLNPQLTRDERYWKVKDWSSVRKRPTPSPAAVAEHSNPTSPQQSTNSSAKKGRIIIDDSDDDEEEEIKGHESWRANNEAIAAALKELGKLHQKCQVHDQDTWKAYTYDKVAGRIRHFDFEVTLDPKTQKRLRKIPGIGDGTQTKIKEFLRDGYIHRVKQFRKDPERIAMKNLMAIWGVGQKKAFVLRKQGCSNIGDVRRGLQEGTIELDRNQRIGVECYEDIMEDFPRSEVEEIGKIIENAVRQQFPEADKDKLTVTIMGSYRRKREVCGDVDVLITHQDYNERVPPHMLGEMVEKLMDSGHIAYHLSYTPGMRWRRGDDYNEGGYNVGGPKAPKYGFDRESEEEKVGSMYMGIMMSPTVKGKRRRVDIKFYPYRERAFAWVYFTGNGFFNRSLRLYASKKMNLQLSDHGLFKRTTGERVLEASSEKEIFEFLGVEYKEPHERDCFDAVIPEEDDIPPEIKREEADHKWID